MSRVGRWLRAVLAAVTCLGSFIAAVVAWSGRVWCFVVTYSAFELALWRDATAMDIERNLSVFLRFRYAKWIAWTMEIIIWRRYKSFVELPLVMKKGEISYIRRNEIPVDLLFDKTRLLWLTGNSSWQPDTPSWHQRHSRRIFSINNWYMNLYIVAYPLFTLAYHSPCSQSTVSRSKARFSPGDPPGSHSTGELGCCQRGLLVTWCLGRSREEDNRSRIRLWDVGLLCRPHVDSYS